MLTTITMVLGFLFTAFMIRVDAHIIVKNEVITRYNRWKELKELVATTEQNKILIMWISLKMVLNILYISILQYMNTTVRKIDRNVYELTYVINGKMYKMIIIPKRGPSPVLQISDDEQNDVTSQVLPYMGPQYDWHGKKLSPMFFHHKSLTFELDDGSEHTYEEDTQFGHEGRNN